MTTAGDTVTLGTVDFDVASAWSAYRAATNSLTADAYARTEEAEWQLLQDRLAELAEIRRELVGDTC